MITWASRVSQAVERSDGLLDDVAREWMAAATVPIDERVTAFIGNADLSDAARIYPPRLADLLLSDIAGGIDRLLGYRYDIQQLEGQFVGAILDLALEKERLDLAESGLPDVADAQARLVAALETPADAGNNEVVRAARSILPEFGSAFARKYSASADSVSDQIRLARRQLDARLGRLMQPGGPLNAPDRTRRLMARLQTELVETCKRVRSASTGLRSPLYELSEEDFRRLSGDRVGIDAPDISGPTLIDDLVAWADAAITFLDRILLRERAATDTKVYSRFWVANADGSLLRQAHQNVHLDPVQDDVTNDPPPPREFSLAGAFQQQRYIQVPIAGGRRRRLRGIGASFTTSAEPSDPNYELCKAAVTEVRIGFGDHPDSTEQLELNQVGLFGYDPSWISGAAVHNLDLPQRLWLHFSRELKTSRGHGLPPAQAFTDYVHGLALHFEYTYDESWPA
jgi:hypothetical protein